MKRGVGGGLRGTVLTEPRPQIHPVVFHPGFPDGNLQQQENPMFISQWSHVLSEL